MNTSPQDTPRVSIIISCYNKESLIRYSVNSALQQENVDCEVIVIDDGSTDQSPKILKELQKNNANLIVIIQKNVGLSGARNTGLKKATGHYVLFHDGDDILFSDAISNLLSSTNTTQKQCDIIGGIFERYAENSPRKLKAFQDDTYTESFFTSPQIYWKHFGNFSSCNKLFRRNFLVDNNLYFAPGLYMQDIDFWFRCVLKAKGLRFTPIVVATYMRTNTSWSTSRTDRRFASFITLATRLDKLRSKLSKEQMASVDGALIQGAGLFFIRWKLQDYALSKNDTDLKSISKILEPISNYSFIKYYEIRKNIIPSLCYLIRLRRYNEAVSLIEHETELKFQNLENTSNYSDLKIEVETKLEKHIQNLFLQMEKYAKSRISDDTGKSNFAAKSPNSLNRHNLNILIFGLGNLYNAGGVQLSYQHLFKHLINNGHSVTLYSHWAEKPDEVFFYEYDEEVQFGFYKLNEHPSCIKNIQKIAKNINPDVILIVNSAQNALILASALYDLPYPVILSERGGADHCLEHSWATKVQREVAHGIVDFSHLLMESYHTAVHPGMIDYVRFIPSGIPLTDQRANTLSANKSGKMTILYTGRLAFEKDLDILIQAFSTLAHSYPNWSLRITGDGPDKEGLEALKNSLLCNSQIHFDGSIRDTDELNLIYQSSHIFVLPSRAEGCPLSLREAFSFGLPSIGFSNCSGTNEIIEHNKNGLLASSDNKVEGLAIALQELMDSSALRKTLGDQAAIDATKYSLESVCSKTESLLIDGAQWRHQRLKLRAYKREYNGNSYKFLEHNFKKIQSSNKIRNIYLFKLSKKTKNLDESLMVAYGLIFGGCLFDWKWYLKENLQVKLSGQDPLTHYLTIGWKKGLRPSLEFDPIFYRRKYLKKSTDICPLVHYYWQGRFKGFLPSTNLDLETIEKMIAELKIDDFYIPIPKPKKSVFKAIFSKFPFLNNYASEKQTLVGLGNVSISKFNKTISSEIVWSRLKRDKIKKVFSHTKKIPLEKKNRAMEKLKSNNVLPKYDIPLHE